ncbi:hypothetical protein ACE38W_14090 [Chitinophaga sp. Hz27]|uniref:hypothetical protein n=1 Tax=Chitinophaga sp. Hz27 TaxID=3347169 RepID=UPI0035E19927
MAKTIAVNEGEVGQATGQDILEYPNINSCLSITAVFTDGKRYGGHVVMFNTDKQLTLKEICDKIIANKGNSTRLIIIGDIGTWNQNWSQLPQTSNLTINGKKVTSVAGLGPAMGFTTNDNWDTDNCVTSGGSYDVYFEYAGTTRQIRVHDKKTNSNCPYFNNKTW